MNIEVIAIAIGAVATVLGGVWFMLQKAFGYGRLVSRIDDVHQRTTNASCDAHDKAIGALKCDMQRIKQDMTSVKTFLSTKYKEESFIFSRKHCPRRLNEVGLRLYKEIDGEKFLQEHREFFFSKIEQMHPKTPFDVDNNAYYVCGAYTNEDIFNGLKNFLYNAPVYRIKDENGVERNYDLSLSDVCFVLSLPLRDMYLEAHPELQNTTQKRVGNAPTLFCVVGGDESVSFPVELLELQVESFLGQLGLWKHFLRLFQQGSFVVITRGEVTDE